ncbi:GDP-mannose-dependent alpha-(1-6)-phosphatidylinositol dimannoside mannosyltransferase [Phycisphaerales bacterium]|nr:GDP-mannose-dependent alpha-(1-6)-phosphatidylinositol dimannoside mannosyltransferase [Phycisphaerales bacterium]
MRIAHYIPAVRLAEGGVVRAVLDLAAVLAADGNGVSLLTSDDSDAPPAWREAGASRPRLVRLPPPVLPGGLFSPAQQRTVAQALAGHDILHLHAMWTPSNLQLARLARRAGVPYVVSVHGMLDDWSMAQRSLKKRCYLLLAGRRWLRNAAAVHCTAAFELDQAAKYFDRSRAEVIPLVFDLDSYRILPGPAAARTAYGLADDDAPILLFLSRIHPKKGLDVLIRAAGVLARGGVDFRLVVAGSGESGYEREMADLAAQQKLGDRCRFVGLVVGPTKVSLYQAADLTVIPTSQENFGFVFIESLACGTPVVTTRGVDIWPELLRSGGATIADAEPRELAEALQSLLRDRAALRQSGEQGRAWVLGSMDPSSIARRFRQCYARAVGAGVRH